MLRPASTAESAIRRCGLPVGFIWGETDGEVRFHPDEAVVTAIRHLLRTRWDQTARSR